MDFTGDPTIGGGIDVLYDNFTDGAGMSLVSYTPNLGNPNFGYGPGSGLAGDPGLTSAPIPDTGALGGNTMLSAPSPLGDRLQGVAFGDADVGLEGPYLVGTLVFDTQQAGTYSLSVAENPDLGGFWAFVPGTPQQQTPYYNFSADGATPMTASVTVDAAPVPLPASIWFMGSALVGLASQRIRPRRQHA